LALRKDPDVDAAVAAMSAADLLVVATPVYRATFSALTKTLFDLLAPDALAGSVTIPIATGAIADHALAIDHGLRPLVASVGGWTTPTGIYGTHADFEDGRPLPHLVATLEKAVA